MSAPRFSPAVLEALARYAATRRAYLDAPDANDRTTVAAYILARNALGNALDADRERAHPVPVGDEDDETRDCSPHRFKATHGSEPL